MALPDSSNVTKTLDLLSISPIPAAVLGSSLLLKGFLGNVSATPAQGTTSSSGSILFRNKLDVIKPTRASCFTFGGASLLGAWMMFDGEPVNASGFNFAWLTLYLIVNGKASILSIFRGRIAPLALGSLALFNAGLYGREFIWSKKSPFQG